MAFIVSVAQEFSPGSQILAAFKLAQYVSQLPEEKPSSKSVLGEKFFVALNFSGFVILNI